MKRILNIAFMVSLLAGLVVLVSFTDSQYRLSNFTGLTVEVLNPAPQSMITKEEIQELVKKNFGELEGAPRAGINLLDLENTVLRNPYVSSCEVYETIGGRLIMLARVREPLVRIVNETGQQYYLDHNGWAMPLNPAHPSLVPVASGFIPDQYISLEKSEKPLSAFPDSSVIHHIYPVAFHISRDSFLKAFIDQIYVNEKKELELVPKIGSQTIIFGKADRAQEKLENLKIFYQKVMSKMDWTVYKSINVKYNNQVVCAKY